jgi:hypothetical protein
MGGRRLIQLLERKPLDRLAFFGPMCSGKTWAANYLVQNHAYVKFGFAKGVKDLAAKLFDVTGKDGNDRLILQKVGGSMREIDPEVWINLALKEIAWFENVNQHVLPSGYVLGEPLPVPKIVIDDLRYLNEAVALQENGFELVKVGTKPDVRTERITNLYPATAEAAHNSPSEQEWAHIVPDYTIRGNGYGEASEGIEALLASRLVYNNVEDYANDRA